MLYSAVANLFPKTTNSAIYLGVPPSKWEIMNAATQSQQIQERGGDASVLSEIRSHSINFMSHVSQWLPNNWTIYLLWTFLEPSLFYKSHLFSNIYFRKIRVKKWVQDRTKESGRERELSVWVLTYNQYGLGVAKCFCPWTTTIIKCSI